MHKIFAIDDILTEIFKYFEPYKLYPCVLVNNQWCKTAVRILWQAPYIPNCFPQPDEKAWKSLKLLARTYLLCLTKNKYEFLKNEGLFLPTAASTTHNYPSFLKVLDISFIYNVADSWIISEIVSEYQKSYYQEMLRMTLIENLIEQANKIQFIHLDGNLKAPISPILNKDTPSLQDLKGLFIYSQMNEQIFVRNIPTFTKQISEIAKKVEHITIREDSYRIDQDKENETNALAELIEASSRLQSLEIIGYRNISQIFKSLQNKSNSLLNLSLKGIDLNQFDKPTIESWSPFIDLKILKKFVVSNDKLFGKFNQAAVLLIIKIIKSANINLQHLELSITPLTPYNRSEIISTITLNCTSLIYLNICNLSNSEIESILINCRKLKVLKFYRRNNFYDDNFIEIAENIPPSLNNLNITIMTKSYYPSSKSFKSFINNLKSNNRLKVLNIFQDKYNNLEESKQILMERGIRLIYSTLLGRINKKLDIL
ncbi:27430_t:CDS:1 [Dentiscutata erythropus]|uniref:27430_t:CDS:1 n=1 Tax=Dentiscutata erythropus TaxID=1348616 RepID=A0A9N9GLU8_9GLOM|nr:27430_t:CDS:1 [Dentiscutata erythropus]